MVQVIVMTSDGKESIVKGFLHQWNKYWSDWQLPLFCGFTPMDVRNFYSIGSFADYPASRWSDAFIKVLDEVAEEIFILLFDDYWLVRQTDMKAINIVTDYMYQFQNVIKFDLTTDRLYADPGKYLYGYNTYNTVGYLDLIKSDFHSAYHLSLWGGMWRRDLLRQFIVSGEAAQQIELNGTSRLAQVGDKLLVLGTRQSPMKHANVIQNREWNQDLMVGLPALTETDRKELQELGCI